MFRAVAIFASLIITAGAAYYFLPQEAKDGIWGRVVGVSFPYIDPVRNIVSKGVNDKTGAFLKSPVERREELLEELRGSVGDLEIQVKRNSGSGAVAEYKDKFTKIENLITNIQENNAGGGALSGVAGALIAKIQGGDSGGATGNEVKSPSASSCVPQ